MSILPYLMNPQLGGMHLGQRPIAPPTMPDNPITRALGGDPLGGSRVPGTEPATGLRLGEAIAKPIDLPPAVAPGNSPGPKGGVGAAILGILGDSLLGYAGRPAVYTPFMQNQMQAEVEAQRRERERMAPRVEQVGNTVGWLNPGSGSFDPLYTAPSVAGQYALDRGFEPGTEEYQNAVADYRLGSWSDDAMAAKRDLEGVRYGYRDELQDQRLEVTRRGQDIRSADTRRGQDIGSSDRRRGQDISRGNSIRSNDTRRGAASYTAAPRGSRSDAPRAVAADGRPIVVKSGRWVYEADGRPVQ